MEKNATMSIFLNTTWVDGSTIFNSLGRGA